MDTYIGLDAHSSRACTPPNPTRPANSGINIRSLPSPLLAGWNFQLQDALQRLTNPPQGGNNSEESQSTAANYRSVVNEYRELAIVTFN